MLVARFLVVSAQASVACRFPIRHFMPASFMSDDASVASSNPPSGLKVCKWCKRPDNTPNPFTFQRDVKPHIPWRRPAGRECGVCPWTIDADAEMAAKDKKTLEKEIHATPENFQKFLDQVAVYEKAKNTTLGDPRGPKRHPKTMRVT